MDECLWYRLRTNCEIGDSIGIEKELSNEIKLILLGFTWTCILRSRSGRWKKESSIESSHPFGFSVAKLGLQL